MDHKKKKVNSNRHIQQRKRSKVMFFWDQHKTITSCYELIAKNVCENYQLTLTLCGGDAFHLVPRIIRAVHGSNDRVKRQLGIGLQVSSITMTVFYIILMYVWKYTFPELTAPVAVEAIIWISAIIRIVVCILPQNNWCTDEGNTNGYHMTRMIAAIIISFGCYLPVTLFSKTKLKVGLLMIPKTCAYMWIVAMGLQLLL